MGLTNSWKIEQVWGSHLPVLKAVLEVLQPQSAVECGSGDFSTPHLLSVPRLHTIEHDPGWALKMESKYPSPPYHKWTVQRFRAKNPTRISELPEGEYQVIKNFYEDMAEAEGSFDLLFVDTFTACRVPATVALGQKARWIILHDLEPPGPEVYEWPRLQSFLQPWRKYMHRPQGSIGNGHQIPWTGLYSILHVDLEALNKVVERESLRLWGQKIPLELVPEEGLLCD